jgi:hypothetical protein
MLAAHVVWGATLSKALDTLRRQERKYLEDLSARHARHRKSTMWSLIDESNADTD